MLSRESFLSIPPHAELRDPDWNLWGGTALRVGDLWYRIFARWHKAATHWGWATSSEIACAVGDSPLGPWRDVRPLMKREESAAWDAHNFHNPCPLYAEGRYWIFYTGNRGDGTFWDHRNHQRIGVASADHPLGPWTRSEKPIVDVTPGGWDHQIAACPIVARGADGLYRMMYKGVSEGPPPFGGVVRMGLATAPHPLGPWTKQGGNFFYRDGVKFTTDDNFFWYEDGVYHAIVKDCGRNYQNHADHALVSFKSPDALHWTPVARDPLLLPPELVIGGKARGPFHRLDQPQLVFDAEGRKIALCVSIKDLADEVDEDLGYLVHIPLSEGRARSAVGGASGLAAAGKKAGVCQ